MLVKNPLCLEEESSQDPPLQNRKEAGFLIERKVRYIVYFVCATKTRSAYTVPAAFQSVRAKVQIVIVSRSWPDVRVLPRRATIASSTLLFVYRPSPE